VIADGGAAQHPDPAVRDVEVARALMARLYREHESGDWMRCHTTALVAHFERMTARHLPIVALERRVDATVGIGNKAPPEDTP
jgi:hypothetical protein